MSWQLKYKHGSWSNWITIPSPTNDISLTRKSTTKKIDLYTGGIGRYTPTVKANYDNVKLSFAFLSATNTLIKNSTVNSGLAVMTIVSGCFPINIKTHSIYSTGKEQTISGYIADTTAIYQLGMYPTTNSGYMTFFDLDMDIDVIGVS